MHPTIISLTSISYSWKDRRYPRPRLRAAHGSDSLGAALGGPLMDYIIQFVATLDPNGSTSNLTASERTIYWPKYDATEERRVLEILDDGFNFQIRNDTSHLEPVKHLTALSIAFSL